jgi:hypothetical protein
MRKKPIQTSGVTKFFSLGHLQSVKSHDAIHSDIFFILDGAKHVTLLLFAIPTDFHIMKLQRNGRCKETKKDE